MESSPEEEKKNHLIFLTHITSAKKISSRKFHSKWREINHFCFSNFFFIFFFVNKTHQI